jgi:hypothetical protein
MQKRASVEFPSLVLSGLRMRVIVVGSLEGVFGHASSQSFGMRKRYAETEYDGCRECFAVSWVIRNGICFEAVVRRYSRGAGSTC